MRAAVLVVCALVAAACSKGKDPAVCRREAGELSQLLSSMDHEPPGFYAADVSLVTRTDVPRTKPARGVTVLVTAEGLTVEGHALDDERTVERLLVAKEASDIVYVAIDEAAPWVAVQSALSHLETLGFDRPALAFARPPAPVTKPPRTKIDDDLDALLAQTEAGNKATELAKMVQKLVKGCAPLHEAFGAVADVDGESKAETLIRAIEPSLVTCNCNLDVASFGSVMFRVLYIAEPQSSFRITLDETGAAIALPPSTPWREAHQRFSPDARVAISAP